MVENGTVGPLPAGTPQAVVDIYRTEAARVGYQILEEAEEGVQEGVQEVEAEMQEVEAVQEVEMAEEDIAVDEDESTHSGLHYDDDDDEEDEEGERKRPAAVTLRSEMSKARKVSESPPKRPDAGGEMEHDEDSGSSGIEVEGEDSEEHEDYEASSPLAPLPFQQSEPHSDDD